jgi:hypothetical protein
MPPMMSLRPAVWVTVTTRDGYPWEPRTVKVCSYPPGPRGLVIFVHGKRITHRPGATHAMDKANMLDR